MNPIPIVYYSDVLCVWAYFAQLRVDAIQRTYGARVQFEYRFCSVFGDTARKISTAWATKGGYEGFNAHILHAASGFPEIKLNPAIWLSVRPASSMAPHLFLKAIQLGAIEGEWGLNVLEIAIRQMRAAFFGEAKDISDQEIHYNVAERASIDLDVIARFIKNGRAHAALATDYKEADISGVQGSPTFILNDGRQKLFGNVGYRIIEANIEELLRQPSADQASWC
jgi:predicted DsbA family dithiol-disulfide isomerase